MKDKSREEYKACIHKKTYPSERKARMVGRDSNLKRIAEVPLGVYHCRFCKKWHLTSSFRRITAWVWYFPELSDAENIRLLREHSTKPFDSAATPSRHQHPVPATTR